MAYLTKGSQLALCAFVGVVLAVCFVSGITGDVPDDVVYTDLHKTVQLGDRAVLKCLFYGTPLAVFWKKGNDPRTAPNLITRIEGEYDLGSCVQDKTCEMNDDYSLTIKNVTIADQGRYICRVSNYMGILIHGYTDFKVYATPEEPYPFINECKENGTNCTVTSQSPLNITCTASRYFPKIDLLFLHGGQKVSTIETVEWKNDYGTKSKLIFTTAPPSKIPYVCMAFNIPGSQDERTATISVYDHHGNITRGEQTESDRSLFIKFALPAGASVAVVCIIVVLVIMYKKCQTRQNGTSTDENTPFLTKQRGKISYYELWFLAGKMTESQANQSKLRDTFKYLKFTAVIREGKLTQVEVYQALCEWKQKNRKVDQPKDLKEALLKFHFDDVWTKMMAEKTSISRKVSRETMKHILWSIGSIEKVNEFLSQLIPDRETINGNENMEFVVEVAVTALAERIDKSTQINPFVLMSLALENAGCTPIDRLLFTVPEKLMSTIPDEKLKEFADELTGRHCKRLAMTMDISKEKMKGSIIGNNQYLLDTRSLITEWLRDMECSNYEKRCRLDDAVITIGRHDLKDFFFKTLVDRPNAEEPRVKSHYFDHESIFDDDILQLVKLVKWLPPDKKTQLKRKIGLPDEADDDEDTLKCKMTAWRDSITSTSSEKVSIDEALEEFQLLRKELINDTKYTDKPECIVSKITIKQLDQKELFDIAFDLMMEDVRPIITELGIDLEKAKTYVKQWNKQNNCTTGLLMNLKKETRNREDFCQALRNVGFIDIARSV